MPHDLRELSRQWFERAWNQRDDSVMPQMIAPAAKLHGLAEDGQTLRGPEEFAHFRRAFLSAFDDLHLDVEDILVDRDQTAIRMSFTATHTGEGLPLPPTHRRLRATAIVVLRWNDDGQVVEAWNEFDAAGMMRQLTASNASTLRVAATVEA
jgi:predicted ester cyclase